MSRIEDIVPSCRSISSTHKMSAAIWLQACGVFKPSCATRREMSKRKEIYLFKDELEMASEKSSPDDQGKQPVKQPVACSSSQYDKKQKIRCEEAEELKERLEAAKEIFAKAADINDSRDHARSLRGAKHKATESERAELAKKIKAKAEKVFHDVGTKAFSYKEYREVTIKEKTEAKRSRGTKEGKKNRKKAAKKRKMQGGPAPP